MSAILQALRRPGATRDVIAAAPTLSCKPEFNGDAEVPGYEVKAKSGLLDRALDRVVRASGSAPVFVFIQSLLVAWAFLGIPFYNTTIWPVVISDAQAIFSYGFDSLLMRQQLNGYNENLVVVAEIRSRARSTRRMLAAIQARLGTADFQRIAASVASQPMQEVSLPKENLFTRCITWTANALGHIYFVVFFWACMIVWLALGPMNEWSNQYQLDINSATSALMVFIFSFLAILRERHADHLRLCLTSVYHLDGALELRLRALTSDTIPHSPTVIPPLKLNPLQRAITYYADVVGTLVGIALLLAVLIIWACIGPALHFNANWWLLIGTYAGLVGLNDGFVLRHMQALHRRHEDPAFAALAGDDRVTLSELGLPCSTQSSDDEACATKSLSARVSERVNAVCAHEATVLSGVLLIVALLVVASVMHWSETGQLVCNIPPSIVESFFMVILITGHNASDRLRRANLRDMLERRRVLLAFVDAVAETAGSGSEKSSAVEEVERE
ncbi:hypothetical protein ANO11243_090890 [Dothideomycetidae sp. 11243]|nr:hypothetical protein ANO11243_090890 [fungal sp. No.11243]